MVMKPLLHIWKVWTPLRPIPDAFFNPLYEKLKMYYVTGGMPESVLMWTEARDRCRYAGSSVRYHWCL